ncbi:hypothetical protein ACFFV7_29645 [Nonomuraea spiralis]|uniref:Uncharacterized protein n=1 Tax=Nonomuraea spiralis TaxID=46182 RepID=A0ABV5ILK2_9ACTN|nr:hypothetical protein GCM10010176_082100 [Nonomuraea spiralis]
MNAVDTSTEELKRTPAAFTDRVTAGGRFGRRTESGRYRLLVNRVCP